MVVLGALVHGLGFALDTEPGDAVHLGGGILLLAAIIPARAYRWRLLLLVSLASAAVLVVANLLYLLLTALGAHSGRT